MGTAASFGAFTPGLGKDYYAATTANVISTAGDAALTVADPDAVSFKQTVSDHDALRTGSYAKTLTFTLSTTTP